MLANRGTPGVAQLLIASIPARFQMNADQNRLEIADLNIRLDRLPAFSIGTLGVGYELGVVTSTPSLCKKPIWILPFGCCRMVLLYYKS